MNPNHDDHGRFATGGHGGPQAHKHVPADGEASASAEAARRGQRVLARAPARTNRQRADAADAAHAQNMAAAGIKRGFERPNAVRGKGRGY